jgi:hypothetical protein
MAGRTTSGSLLQYRPSAASGLLRIVIALTGVVAGVILITNEVVIVGGALAAISLIGLLLLLKVKFLDYPTILLSRGGLTVRSGASSRAFRWSEIQAFRVEGILWNKRLVFVVRENIGRHGPFSGPGGSQAFPGEVVEIPDVYPRPVSELAQIFSDWQRKYS